jgi:arginyl-tRNA synthetase
MFLRRPSSSTSSSSTTATHSLNVLVDYASPNMAKELHVGHLRSTIIGDAIANTLEFVGHRVERVSHVGDFGTPVAIVIAMALEQRLDWTMSRTAAAAADDDDDVPSVNALTKLYVDGKARRESERAFAALVDDIVLVLQGLASRSSRFADDAAHVERIRRAWRVVCAASRRSFERIFARLGVVGLVERGESFYVAQLAAIVDRLQRANLVQQNAGGSSCGNDADADGEDGGLIAHVCGAPLVVRKRDGSYLYATTDLAGVQHRSNKDWVVYVVDASQSLVIQCRCAEIFRKFVYNSNVAFSTSNKDSSYAL